MTHELVIPRWTPTPVNRLMARVRARIQGKKYDRLVVFAEAFNARIPRATGKRRVSVRCTMPGRLADPDNLLKSLLDCLVHARLLVDDSPAWVELGRVKVERGSSRQTVVTLEDMDGATVVDG